MAQKYNFIIPEVTQSVELTDRTHHNEPVNLTKCTGLCRHKTNGLADVTIYILEFEGCLKASGPKQWMFTDEVERDAEFGRYKCAQFNMVTL